MKARHTEYLRIERIWRGGEEEGDRGSTYYSVLIISYDHPEGL